MATRFYSSVEYSGQRRSNDADCIYYNATIVNNSVRDADANVPDPQVSFNEVRQTPILQDPSDYMVAVMKMSSTGANLNLPLWIPRIQTNSVQASFLGSVSGSTLTIQGGVSGSIFPGQTNAILYVNGIPSGLYITAQTGVNPLTFTLNQPYVGSSLYFPMALELLQVDPNLTVYSVTVETPFAVAQTFLQWIPANQYAPLPGTPVAVQQLNTDYYYAYTYQLFVDMVNTALQTAWGQAQVAGFSTPTFTWSNSGGNGGGAFNRNNPPYFQFNINGTSASALEAADVKIWLNTPLETMISNFPGRYYNLDNGRTFQLKFGDEPTLSAGTNAICVQDYPSVSMWSPVENLSVTSSLLPLVMEQTPPPGAVGTSSFDTQGDVVGSSFLPLLLDNIPYITASSDWRQTTLYEPNAEYRMISLSSTDSPIQNIDLQVWWRNRLDNHLYPLRLVSGSSLTIKLLFRRKQMGV